MNEGKLLSERERLYVCLCACMQCAHTSCVLIKGPFWVSNMDVRVIPKVFLWHLKTREVFNPPSYSSPPIFALAYINGVTIQRRTFTTTFFSSFYSCLHFSPCHLPLLQWIFKIFSITMLQLQLLQLLLLQCRCSLTSLIANISAHGMTAANAFHDVQIFHDIVVFTLVNDLIIVNGKDVANNLSKDQL